MSKALASDGKFTDSEKELVVEALIESTDKGETLTKEQVAAAGVQLSDLPASTPVETRQDSFGNPLVITAEVAVAVELISNALENPAALVSAVLENPAELISALGSMGLDMTEEEREESQDVIVASVVASQIAQTATTAAAVARAGGAPPSAPSGGAPAGGPAGPSSSGDGSAKKQSGKSGRMRRTPKSPVRKAIK